MTYDDDTDELPDLTNREILAVVMQEFADMRNELKQEFKQDLSELKTELKEDIAKLSGRVDKVASELHTLRIEVHQNHSTFIANQRAMEKRVKTLEMAA